MHRKLWMGIAAIVLFCLTVPFSFRAISAEKKESIEARLKRMENREEIRQLLTDYGRYLDQRDWASFSQLFAEKDGEWIGGMGRAKGSQEVRKLMVDTIGSNKGTPAAGGNYHLFMNETIDVNGDTGKATTKWMFVVQNSSKQPQPFYLGHYEDTLIREQGRWKFLKRVVYSDIPADDPLSRK